MKTDVVDLAARVEALLGSGRVTTTGLAHWAVNGIVPRVVVRPSDEEQLAATLRVCGEAGAAVVPRGGGTAMEVGNPPRAADVILLTDRLSRIIDYDHSNLTVTVQPGLALDALGREIIIQRQFLALDPPHTEAATVGGTAAVNLNGPRRMLYGGVRDMVIGVRAVQADGVAIRWGGKTVKNVAGYDMCKLFVGSMGTLGVITELTLKLFPLPETSRTLVCTSRDAGAAAALAMRILTSPLLPAAVTVLNARAAAAIGEEVGDPAAGAVLVRAEGFRSAVDRHERDVTDWAAQAGMEVRMLDGDAESGVWRTIRDFGWTGSAAAIRLSTPPAGVPGLLSELHALLPASAGVVCHAGSGTTWIEIDAADLSPPIHSALRDLVQRHQGHLLIARAPKALQVDDVWFPPPDALPLMRVLKQSFDPHHVLNPGRFVAGL